MPENAFEIHGASVADAPTERSGDFVINNTIIHCTTMPSALLIEKCKANLRGGCHPVIITIFERVHMALNLAEDAGLAGRVEVWDIQQMYTSIAFLMKVREILRFQILLVVIIKLFLKLKLIRAFVLSLRRDDLSWRIFLIMKNALKSCEKLNQKRINQQNCD